MGYRFPPLLKIYLCFPPAVVMEKKQGIPTETVSLGTTLCRKRWLGCCLQGVALATVTPRRRRMPSEEGFSRYREKEVASMRWKSLPMPRNKIARQWVGAKPCRTFHFLFDTGLECRASRPWFALWKATPPWGSYRRHWGQKVGVGIFGSLRNGNAPGWVVVAEASQMCVNYSVCVWGGAHKSSFYVLCCGFANFYIPPGPLFSVVSKEVVSMFAQKLSLRWHSPWRMWFIISTDFNLFLLTYHTLPFHYRLNVAVVGEASIVFTSSLATSWDHLELY